MGLNWAEHTEEIDAPIETCFEAITDYESFPRWQDAVDSVEVLSLTEDGIGQDVRLFIDAKIRKIDYVLRYSYDRPTGIHWDFVEGNGMRDCDGAYTLEQLGSGRTRATYKLGADPELPVPGMILRRTHKQLVKRSVEDLKAEAERRHRAGERPAEADVGVEAREEEPDQTQDDAQDDWVPKAAREAQRPAREAGEPPPRRPGQRGHGSAAELPLALLGKAVSGGREVAEGALRAGVGAAGSVLEAGRETAAELIERANRKLDGDDRGRDRRD